jgi:hypothetical protein
MIAVPLACEESHGRDEERPGVEALQQETRDRDDDRHREQERRREPLRGARGDAEVLGERGKRDAHDRLIEDHDEHGDQQQEDHEAIARADRGGWFAVKGGGFGGWRRCWSS